jgi:hypothetical protein
VSFNPSRLREDGPPQLRRIIESARLDEPSAAELASLSAALSGATMPMVAKGPAAPAGPMALSTTGLKVLVAMAIAGATAGAGWWLLTPPHMVPVRGPTAPILAPHAPVAGAPVTGPPPKEPSANGLVGPVAPRQPSRPSNAPAAPAPLPTDEATLLSRAFDALQRGQANSVLAATAQHEREFPHGALIEEREVLAIKALIALGRAGEAEQRLEAFEERFPRSTHRQRLRSMLDPPP